MKIKYKAELSNKFTEDTIEDYAKRKLDGDDYDRGTAEASRATADNATQALGRLLDVLASNGLLTADDVVQVVEDHNNHTNIALVKED